MLAGIKTKAKLKYHLKFTRRNKLKGKKTNIYNVIKVQRDKLNENYDSVETHLGLIKWNGAFRQYWFEPNNDTGWSADCMDLVSAFLKETNKRYRKKWQKLRNPKLRSKKK